MNMMKYIQPMDCLRWIVYVKEYWVGSSFGILHNRIKLMWKNHKICATYFDNRCVQQRELKGIVYYHYVLSERRRAHDLHYQTEKEIQYLKVYPVCRIEANKYKSPIYLQSTHLLFNNSYCFTLWGERYRSICLLDIEYMKLLPIDRLLPSQRLIPWDSRLIVLTKGYELMSNGSLITQAGLHLDKIVEIEEGKVLIFANK